MSVSIIPLCSGEMLLNRLASSPSTIIKSSTQCASMAMVGCSSSAVRTCAVRLLGSSTLPRGTSDVSALVCVLISRPRLEYSFFTCRSCVDACLLYLPWLSLGRISLGATLQFMRGEPRCAGSVVPLPLPLPLKGRPLPDAPALLPMGAERLRRVTYSNADREELPPPPPRTG